jgi:hypothetical protein
VRAGSGPRENDAVNLKTIYLMVLAAAAQPVVTAMGIEVVEALQAYALHFLEWHDGHIVSPEG